MAGYLNNLNVKSMIPGSKYSKFYCVLYLQMKKMYIKLDAQRTDEDTSNILIKLESIIKIDIEQGPNKKDL